MPYYESGTYWYTSREATTELGISGKLLNKLVGLGIIEKTTFPSNPHRRSYGGKEMEELLRDSNNLLELNPGEKALIVTKRPSGDGRTPSAFSDRSECPQQEGSTYSTLLSKVDEETRDKIQEGRLLVSISWRVAEDKAYDLVKNRSLFLTSYAGFLREGGHVVDVVPGVIGENGGRCFVVEPLDEEEKAKYCHTFFPSLQGPSSKVWSAEEIAEKTLPLR